MGNFFEKTSICAIQTSSLNREARKQKHEFSSVDHGVQFRHGKSCCKVRRTFFELACKSVSAVKVAEDVNSTGTLATGCAQIVLTWLYLASICRTVFTMDGKFAGKIGHQMEQSLRNQMGTNDTFS